MKYLLPCPQCSQSVEIDVTQAGERVACPCGNVMEAPSFRGLRALAPATAVAAKAGRPAARPGAVVWRLAFVGALFIIVTGVCFGSFHFLRARMITVPGAVPVDYRAIEASVEILTPEGAWKMWRDLRDQGPGAYMVPEREIALRLEAGHMYFARGGAALAGIGVLLAAAAVLLSAVTRQKN